MRSSAVVQARSRAGLRREWLVLSALLLSLVAWLCSSEGLRRIDHLVQDMGMRLQALPAHPDIAIVAIDDRSIESIGRWPWRRALHAQLVRQIAEQSPRALGLDILFGEEDVDYPGDDLLLVRALEGSRNAVLPVARRGQSGMADLPLLPLRRAAAALGHVQVQVDADGVTRGLFRREGPASSPWPHFSTALLCAEDPDRPPCPTPMDAGAGEWVRAEPQILAFAHGQPAFATYSYVDVLKGRLPPEALRNKYVLVGATATGLGDMFAAPVGPRSERIAGVELIAHALNAELAQSRIQPAPWAWNQAFNLAPVALALLGILLLGPLAGLVSCAAWFAGTLALAMLAPGLLGWQLAPAPALVGIALVYPLWSWRRLSAAAHFLQLEMQELQRAGLSPAPPRPHGPLLSGDLLEHRIHAVEDATRRLRKLHHFVSNSLQHLPSPTFVCDAAGRVTLANEAAVDYCQCPAVGDSITQVLAGLVHDTTGAPLMPQDVGYLAAFPLQQEARDAQGRQLLLLFKPFADEDGTLWLLTLVDLTEMRRAQTQRDQALHFISHDIRAPIASIRTLLEMHRAFPNRMAQQDLLARIDRYAQSSLAMAQSFVHLASAQADTYDQSLIDLAAILTEAVDDGWVPAQERGVRIHLAPGPEQAICLGDRNLIGRAVGNVLGNALKFSPSDATVHCALQAQAPYWVVSIRDEGPGIPQEHQGELFQPFKRLHGHSHPEVGGAGLGLAFVRTVVERHGGKVEVQSAWGEGAQFRLLFPQAVAPDSVHTG